MASSSKRPLATYGKDAPPSKKPKFSLRNPSALAEAPSDDDDEANAELEADVIGSNQPHLKRNAVNIDGFDSDSGDEAAFDERADARAKADKQARKSKVEEDADMFADLEEDFADDSDGDAAKKRKKKDVRFLDGDQIEGQVKQSTGGGHVGSRLHLTDEEARYMDKHGVLPASAKLQDADGDGSSDESEVDDERRAALDEEIDEELGAGAKTRHAPKLDAFNMRDENQEGAFDESGNFVRKAADKDAVHDRWLEGTSKKDMKRAAEAHEKREEERRKRDREDDQRSPADVLGSLIGRMEVGETVLEALARLGRSKTKSKTKKQSKWQKNRKQNEIAVEGEPNGHNGEDDAKAEEAEARRKTDVEALTAAADLMLTRGMTDIYDTEREMLMRQYQRENGGEAWRDPEPEHEDDANGNDVDAAAATKMWEYRWTDARDGGHVNGPYDGGTMRQWNEAGYFNGAIEFRPAGGSTWSAAAGFV
jgi:CD2 antigen cytoplasmic tail-binding protein 2